MESDPVTTMIVSGVPLFDKLSSSLSNQETKDVLSCEIFDWNHLPKDRVWDCRNETGLTEPNKGFPSHRLRPEASTLDWDFP